MRIDKFLKVSHILKRRSLGKQACDAERVMVNGKSVKPSFKLKENDVVEVLFSGKTLKFKVFKLKETVRKDEAPTLYEIIND